MFNDFSADLKQICDRVLTQDSFLKLFPTKDANEITRRAVLDIKCDCICPSSTLPSETETDRQTLTSDFTPGPGIPSLKELRDSLQTESRDEVEWTLPILTHGLTLPIDHWDVVKHSSHVFCFWLRNLLSPGATALSSYPKTLRRDPLRYLDRLLFSLCYFFFPRHPEPLANLQKWTVYTLGQSGPDTRNRPSGSDALDGSQNAATYSTAERPVSPSVLQSKLELAKQIVQAVEAVVSNASSLSVNAWESLLQFSLVVCHLVLSQPLPVPAHRLRQSLNSFTSYVQTSSTGTDLGIGSVIYQTPETQNDPVLLYETLVDSVVGMLVNNWLNACVHCFPRPQMWQALKECARTWRHQSVFIAYWSQLVVMLTSKMISDLYGADKSATDGACVTSQAGSPSEQSRSFNFPTGMSAEIVKQTWFRFFYLLGNPVDICDQQTLETPVLEKFKKIAPLEHLALTTSHIPYTFHVAVRGIAAAVDSILGMSVSILGGTDPLKWVPGELYFQPSSASGLTEAVVNIPELEVPPESKRIGPQSYTKSRGAAPNLISEKSSRKLKLPVAVGNASFFASATPLNPRNADSSLTPASSSQTPASTPGASFLPQTWSNSSVTMSIAFQQTLASMQQQQLAIIAASSSTGSFAGSVFFWPGFSGDHKTNVSQSTAAQWLGPAPHMSVSNQRPEANTLFQLVGPWLLEAAIIGAEKNLSHPSFAVISTRVEQFSTYLNFQVGRAEALGALCRIVLYAKRNHLARQFLVRFYLCLHYALEIGTGRCDYVLSSVLYNAVDLLRCDLPGVNILLPSIFDACVLVYKEQLHHLPKYLNMTLLRRAAIHQLMSMVCIPIQFKGRTLKPMVPIATSPKDPVSLSDLKHQLAYFLCDALKSENDAINFQMLLSTTLVLLEDMVADELVNSSRRVSVKPGNSQRLYTVSSFFNTLMPILGARLKKKDESDLIIQNLLEFLFSAGSIRVSPADPDVYRGLVRQVCGFISTQCQRLPIYHKRQLHTIIVLAFSVLSTLLVRHSDFVLGDPDCLQTVLGAIELGISGTESNDPSKNLIQKEQKLLTPISKRVQDAAESCLSVFISLSGSYPGASGPFETSSTITEDQLIDMLTPVDLAKQPELGRLLREQFCYFWADPGVIIGFLEFSRCRVILESKGYKLDETQLSNLPETIIIVRSPFGRHCWMARMRLLPVHGPESQSAVTVKTKPSRPEPWGCFLERLIETVNKNELLESRCFPEAVSEVPLVDADLSIPRLENLMGEPGSSSRELLHNLKSTIMKQSLRIREAGARCLKERSVAHKPPALIDAAPLTPKFSHYSSRLWLTHLSYLPYNTFNMVEPGTPGAEKFLTSARAADAEDTGEKVPLSAATSVMNMSTDWDASPTQPCVTLFPIDSKDPAFYNYLADLDRLRTRIANKMLLFYIAAEQTSAEDVLSNMSASSWPNLQPEFHAFVRGIGNVIPVKNLSKSTAANKTRYIDAAPCETVDGLALPDGLRHVVHWADATAELTCFCPTTLDLAPNVDKTGASSTLKPAGNTIPQATDSESDPTGGRVAVVWLERWEDGPINASSDSPSWFINELTKQKFDCPVAIFICMLKSKLYRIGVLSSPGQVFKAGPLINGLIVSSRCLSSLVRQTVTNIARRRRLASDAFIPPHVRRKYRICELEQSHKQRQSNQLLDKDAYAGHPEALLSLFASAT